MTTLFKKGYTFLMKNSITDYLRQDNKALGKLMAKVSQLQQWNNWLKESLEHDFALSEHCFITSLSGKSLIVFADNPHWVTRFRFHIPALIIKLKKYDDFKTIQSICCKVQPNYVPVSPKRREPQLKLSKKSARIVKDTAEKISDEKLQASLTKIAMNC